MRLTKTFSCDILVVGSGIAGISAAIKAAESGASVILTCKGQLFSGSSFYPGTWGLGLIGPANQEDGVDLAETIQSVGCNMATPEMVKTFVSGIHPAIERVRNMGVKLRRADKSAQKEYIPCFDHKHRDWNGIEFDSAREVFSRKLEEQGVKILPYCEVLDLVKAQDRICGAVLAVEGKLCYAGCKAVVLATGGYGSLFKYHLCTEDVLGNGQYMALKAGCCLVNMEFMQMMPGYISPAPKTIFNERTFRFSEFTKADGTPLPENKEIQALAVRSTHGPFTCRLPSKVIDLALFNAFTENEEGVSAAYSQEMQQNPPEFVQVYFDWLLQSKGVAMRDVIRIGIFAHAANGGIQTRSDASTGIPGLFAAGEVTGGMHGADRIGGLSTANGLVFGTIAGSSAADYVRSCETGPEEWEYTAYAAPGCDEALTVLQQTMFRNAMIVRSESGLTEALRTVEELREQITSSLEKSEDIEAVVKTQRFIARCATAESILSAALLRKESRGSHFRIDYPEQDKNQEKQIIIRMNADGICATFSKDV